MGYLYPRVDLTAVEAEYRDVRLLPIEDLRSKSALAHPKQTFAATGGERVPSSHLGDLREAVRALADSCGWPAEPSVEQRQVFDAGGARLLYEDMGIVPADAGSNGVWMFLTLVVFPDIGPWRWSSRNDRRLLDHQRNTFRSMYWRAFVLGAGPGGSLEQLGEDEIVAIVERASLSGNPTTARTVASVFIDSLERLPQGVGRMHLMREYAKRLTRLASVVMLDGLSESDLLTLCGEQLGLARTALQEK